MIRIASEADIAEMHRIRVSVRENRLSNPRSVQPADYISMLTEHGRGWIAEVDERVAGFAVADRSRANVWALFVDPPYEARGIGRVLHDTMMSWIFSEGVERAWLGTDPRTRAEQFYRSAGWQYVGQHGSEARYELTLQDWLALSPRL